MHKLDELLAYLEGGDVKTSLILFKKPKEGYMIRVRIGNRVWMYEPFTTKEHAKDHVFREILLAGVDMLIDDELWDRYREKLTTKFSNHGKQTTSTSTEQE